MSGKQFKLLDDFRVWGPAGIKEAWPINSWYWMRLRHDPNATGGTDDVFAKVWLADGKTDEPADGQTKWNYIPTRTARKGFAGITGSSIDGLGSFERITTPIETQNPRCLSRARRKESRDCKS